MALLSFLNKSNEESVILIDIGNYTITGSLTIFKKNSKPVFLYVIKKFFGTSEKLESKKLESEMDVLLDDTLKDILKNGFVHKYWNGKRSKIDKILISFSSPWFLSKTKSIHFDNDKEFVITTTFLNDILNKESEILKNELNPNEPDAFQVVEKSIIHTKINGYTLDNIVGKNTKVFDASLYMSVVSKNFIKKTLETIHKNTHLSVEKIIINTFPLVLFSLVRDSFTKESDFILMDITGEITDITLVRDEIIEKTVSFPSGKNFIIRQIAKTLNISNEIAESTFRMYISKKLDETTILKVSEVLILVEKEWSIYFENALLELSPEMVLPNSVFMTSDEDSVDIYTDFLSIKKMDSTNLFRNNININHISLEKLVSFYTNESGFALDEFVVTLALFYKKIIDQNI